MIDPGTGILLIADPFLKDPNFLRTVVFLCDHQPEASFGFVLNRPVKSTLGELVTTLSGHKIPVYYGGPVQPDTLHFLHQYPDEIPDPVDVMNGIYWGGNFETVTALINSHRIDPNRMRFFLGYSGWGENQLRAEIDEKSWLTVPANCKLVFETTEQKIWEESLRKLGGEYEALINYPIDPQLN